MNQEAVGAISGWLMEPMQEGMRVLVVGGPPGASKRQHVLAGVCGEGPRPVVRAATAVPADASGNYDFLIRSGMAEIDLGQYAGAHRKSATVTVTGAVEALRNQRTIKGAALRRPPVLVLRNHHTARADCMLAALNSAAGSVGHVVILTERPTAACEIAGAWDVSFLTLPALSGMPRQRALESGYVLTTSHDKKGVALVESVVLAVTAPGVRGVPGLRKLATYLLRDQHDGGYLAMQVAERLEVGGWVDSRVLARAVQKLMSGLENGYRLHLHWEMFLVTLAARSK